MKKFIGSILFASILFAGFGAIVEKTAASFRSDEKALALLQKARVAIGGDVAINNVKSMSITGKRTIAFDLGGAARTEQADVEVNLELPGKLSKTIRVGDAQGGDKVIGKTVDVVVVAKGDGKNFEFTQKDDSEIRTDAVKRVIVKKADGTEQVLTENVEPVTLSRTENKDMVVTGDDNKKVVIRRVGGPTDVPQGGQQNELFRTTLSLLLSAPQGLDVSYTYAGEGVVDGNSVEIIDAAIGESAVKLYLDRSTSLPRMISFKGHAPVMMVFKKDGDGAVKEENVKVFETRMAAPEMTEIQIKYSDYRTVGGLLLPHKWTQVSGGKEETTDITGYEINPANIADKFKTNGVNVFVTKKDN